ncbi:MAG: hypothetical protein ACPGU1_22770, partial [Myxococcota bacterium]
MNRLMAILVLGTLAVGCGDVESTAETQAPPFTVGEADAGAEPATAEGDTVSAEPNPEPESDTIEPEPESDTIEPEPESDTTEPEPESDTIEPEPESDTTDPASDATDPESDAGPADDVEAPCVPSCEGMACGDDGCGGSCGSCGDDDLCNGTEAC